MSGIHSQRNPHTFDYEEMESYRKQQAALVESFERAALKKRRREGSRLYQATSRGLPGSERREPNGLHLRATMAAFTDIC